MESLLPPDPYKALGVARDADIALIKKTFRKLALSCHPDKVADESLKQQKQEEFHKINQAYELIGDEASRQRYDDEYKLEQLRSEKLARGGAKVSEPTASRYGVRTQAPSGEPWSAETARRYEERKPARSYDDRAYDDRSRKYDSYDSYAKPSSSSRSSREKEIPIKITRVSTDRTRADHKKSRDKEDRRERDRRFVSVESDSDEKARYEAEYRRRSDEARRRDDEEAARKAAADARRKAEERRSYDDKYDRQRKLSEMENDAVRYIHRSRVEAERPSPSRTTSSRDVRPDYYESRSRRDPRRSSARPKDSPTASGRDRDRKGIEIVDWDSDAKVPSFKHSSSSPADLHVPRATPQRSYTESSRDHRHTETSPTPKFRRSETMPVRRTEANVSRPSGLRESVTPHDSGASSPEAYPTVPPPSSTTTKKYYYPTPGGGVRLSPDDVGVANGHRTILREPDHHRTRSTSPLSRPPMGANRPIDPSTNYPTAAPKVSIPPPPLGRSATMNVDPVRASEDRGRRLYGEIPTDKVRRENRGRQTSFSPDQISYTPRIGPEDIRWSANASRGRDTGLERDREYAKPMLNRHATYAY
jgi:curved DNA-binding protein CbpA